MSLSPQYMRTPFKFHSRSLYKEMTDVDFRVPRKESSHNLPSKNSHTERCSVYRDIFYCLSKPPVKESPSRFGDVAPMKKDATFQRLPLRTQQSPQKKELYL